MAAWSEAKCAGYALAALIAGDRALAAADSIPAAEAARTRTLVAHGGDKTPQARRQLVQGLLAAVRPEIALEGLPPRIATVLAKRARPSRAVPADLWPRLYRIARYYRGTP